MPADKKGPVLFGAAILVLLVIALTACQLTGNRGIEDRFRQAVGQPVEGPVEGRGQVSGFAVEGDILKYLVVLVLLFSVCIIAYKKKKL
jgi:hypothetical protein